MKIRVPANAVLSVIFSPRSKADSISTNSRLALSTGATFEASAIFSDGIQVVSEGKTCIPLLLKKIEANHVFCLTWQKIG